jgi:hypothetical protein
MPTDNGTIAIAILWFEVDLRDQNPSRPTPGKARRRGAHQIQARHYFERPQTVASTRSAENLPSPSPDGGAPNRGARLAVLARLKIGMGRRRSTKLPP